VKSSLAAADVVLLDIPLNNKTIGFIGTNEFAMMKANVGEACSEKVVQSLISMVLQ